MINFDINIGNFVILQKDHHISFTFFHFVVDGIFVILRTQHKTKGNQN